MEPSKTQWLPFPSRFALSRKSQNPVTHKGADILRPEDLDFFYISSVAVRTAVEV